MTGNVLLYFSIVEMAAKEKKWCSGPFPKDILSKHEVKNYDPTEITK